MEQEAVAPHIETRAVAVPPAGDINAAGVLNDLLVINLKTANSLGVKVPASASCRR